MNCYICNLTAGPTAEADGWQRALIRGSFDELFVQAVFCPVHTNQLPAYLVKDADLGLQTFAEVGPWQSAIAIDQAQRSSAWQPMTTAPKDRLILVKRATTLGGEVVEQLYVVRYDSLYRDWMTEPGEHLISMMGPRAGVPWLWADIPS